MKLPESLQPSRLFSKNRRGVALITVLTVIALTTILVMTFFTLATSEHRASNTYSQGLQAQQVAEQAVNLVIAQIREATVREAGEAPIAWASQPGAIRVWEENGNVGFAYKLYSDDLLMTKDWTDFQKDFQDATTWSSRPDHFVDLNEPVIRGQKVYYPIVHPAAATEPKWPKPLGKDSDGIEGFRYNADGQVLRDEGPIGGQASRIAGVNGHVAMPVRWIYQLADGTLGTLDSSGSGGGGAGASFRFKPFAGNNGSPSAQNPMVARFAFWADDETAKLNMNVHAGGLAWDIPRAAGEMDMDMAKHQPTQKEWQRYPGHPATTHLGPALAPGVLDIVNDRNAMEMLFNVVPRVVGGGSESGTRVIDTRNPKEANGLIADTEPLFPSLDDVVMRADREPHRFPDSRGRAIPPEQLSDYLERAKFFITVNSRAPETNIFNKPKIAMWPIYNANPGGSTYNTHLSAFDRLIHYCASMGENKGGGYPRFEYLFKRERHDSATHDYQQIPRNQELYRYLARLMDQRVPGYGGSFSDKYGKESAMQLLTMMFDYIRSTNLHDDTLFSQDFAAAFQVKNTAQHVTFTNPRDDAVKGFGHKGHGQVTPILINEGGVETKGIGRFFSVSGADIVVASLGEFGFRPNELYPGVTQWAPIDNRVVVEAASGNLYTNLPPLPIGVTKTSDKAGWPSWLIALENGTEAEKAEFNAAFDPIHWNWQLAFMDSAYTQAVLDNPTVNKFNQRLITKAACENMRLRPEERLVQASFLFNMFCPGIGWGSINPDMEVHIQREQGMTFSGLDGTSPGFIGFEGNYGSKGDPDGTPNTFIWATNWAKPHKLGGARSWGGLLSFGYMLSAREALQETRPERHVWFHLNRSGFTLNGSLRARVTPLDKGYHNVGDALRSVRGRDLGQNNLNDIAQSYRYDLVTLPFKVSRDTMNFRGGRVKFLVYNGGKHTEGSARAGGTPDLVQEVEMEFPPFTVPSPVMAGGFGGYIDEYGGRHDSHNSLELASLTSDPGTSLGTAATKYLVKSGARGPGVGNMIGRMTLLTNHWDSPSTYIRSGDLVQSIAIQHGDMRLAAAKRRIVPADKIFGPHRDYGTKRLAHSLTTSSGNPIVGYAPGARENKPYLLVPDLPGNNPYGGVTPMAMAGTAKSNEIQLYGDFDNGAGVMVDGPYINKPDEGNVHALKTKFTQDLVFYWEQRYRAGDFPYFSNPEYAEAGGPAYFSPNRMISGPGMFGSLPSSLGTNPPKPWLTLLFRPSVAGNGFTAHPGREGFSVRTLSPQAKLPPDHLLMDLFWMPVVEPYAISEPLSTAGKVNMNYQIVPFLHVHRDTALRGVFRSESMLCIPNQWNRSYKHGRGRGQGWHPDRNPSGGDLQGKRLRSSIVEDATLVQFAKKRFKNGENLFRSASEICDIHLVPEEASVRAGRGGRGSIGSYTPSVNESSGSVPDMENGKYWRDHSLVGDNSRERPYTNIQARLTTKSNTFQVHYRAQVIKQSRRENESEYGEWRPSTDTVQAEYRGSSVVERYVDPNGEMPDFADPNARSVDEFYRFRVINPRRFAP